MSVPITITNAGLAKLPSPTGSGTSAITITAVGLTATAFTPDPTMTALPGELARVTTLSGNAVTPDTIHLLMQDTSANAYAATGFALYLADGTLFAVYGQATAFLVKTAASIGMLAVDIAFASALATSITFGNANFIDPPASTTTPGVVQLATLAIAQAGADTRQAITPSTAANSIVAWLLARDGAGSGIDADMLDGQHGAWYADIVSRLGYTPLNAALYTAASVLAKLITVDGAGSGVDADLFHGLTPAQFLSQFFGTGSNANGRWETRPNGILEQWGAINYTTIYEDPSHGPGTYIITFPKPFSDTNYSINPTNHNPVPHYDNGAWPQIVSKSLGSCTIYNMWTGGGDGTIYGLDWRAIGNS